MAGADRRGIFAKGDIAHVMERFDGPVAAAKALQLGSVHLRSRAAAQEDLGLFGDLKAFEMMGGAQDESGLDGVWEAGLFGRNLKGIDFAGFMASMPLVQGEIRWGKKRLSAPEPGGPVCRRAWVDWL
jgi:hypothetical protein